jgi:hypothetical protein
VTDTRHSLHLDDDLFLLPLWCFLWCVVEEARKMSDKLKSTFDWCDAVSEKRSGRWMTISRDLTAT